MFCTAEAGNIFSRSFWECCWDVTAERCPAGSALPVFQMTGRITTTFCRHWAASQSTSPNNCCMSLFGRFPSVMLVSSSTWLWMTRRQSGTDRRCNWLACTTIRHPVIRFRIPVRPCLGDHQLARGASAVGLHWNAADRSAIEQNFHDVKEVHAAGEQQVRNVWCNVACWNLCLWLHTMVELWSWRRSGTTLKQRDDRPWDAPTRRPSHADRLKTLKQHTLCETFSALPRRQRSARKIQRLFQALARLVN
jgi:hypothetical protein